MEEPREEQEREEEEKIPYWQVFYDDFFLLFLLGIVIFAVSYTIWGLMDIAAVPPAPALKP